MASFCARKVIHSIVSNLVRTSTCTKNILLPFTQFACHNGDQRSNFTRQIHTSVPRSVIKPRDRTDYIRDAGKIEEGTIGEHITNLDAKILKKEDMFIDDKTQDLLFNGVKFKDLPICHVKVTKNNTIFSVSDCAGKTMIIRTCGMEGFKNCRRGTNVAAQATAICVGRRALAKGVSDVRVKIQGLGPGRMASLKGLQLAGLNIISLTDDTRISFNPSARPKKQRRL